MTDSQKWLIGVATIFIIGIFYLLTPILTPFMIAALIAYLGDPLVNRLQRYKIPRTISVLLVFLIIVIILLLLILMLIPMLERQINVFIVKVPQLLEWFQVVALPWIQQNLGINESLNLATLKDELGQHWQQATNILAIISKTIAHSGLALIDFAVSLILVPVVAFYLMRDWGKLVLAIQTLLPRAIEPTVAFIVRECDEVLGAFLRGQLLVMVALGFIYSIGLAFTGLDLALLIGMIAGLVSIVPYLGFIVGIAAAMIAGIMQFHDSIHLIYIAIVFIIGQLAESMLLTPLLIGDKIGLHPVAVIFAILAGGQLFGFTGILLALPIAAIIVVCLRHIRQRYMKSELYS